LSVSQLDLVTGDVIVSDEMRCVTKPEGDETYILERRRRVWQKG